MRLTDGFREWEGLWWCWQHNCIEDEGLESGSARAARSCWCMVVHHAARAIVHGLHLYQLQPHLCTGLDVSSSLLILEVLSAQGTVALLRLQGF